MGQEKFVFHAMSKSNHVFGIISAKTLDKALGYLKERYPSAEKISVLEETVQDREGEVQEFLRWGELPECCI